VSIDWSTDALLADYRRRVAENYLAEPVDGEEGWLAFRRRRDQLFLTHPRSALDEEQKAETSSLPYFPYSPHARVETRLESVGPDTDVLTIDTGGEDGVMRFKRLGRLATPFGALTLFWLTGYGGGLFLPFRDATSVRETYGAGRYLTDTAKGTFGRGVSVDGERAVLDFNYAYNPSCAYYSMAACPLAPRENQLATRIEAGELRFPLPH
jgi:uncharacterized protein (DUF1684 family)